MIPIDFYIAYVFATTALISINCYIKNAIGQVIYHNYQDNLFGLFNDKVDLSSVNKGVYFIELQINDQKVYRRLVIQ